MCQLVSLDFIDRRRLANHLRDDDHVSEMRLYSRRLLIGELFLLCLCELL